MILRGLSIKFGQSYTLSWTELNEEYQRFDCLPGSNGNEAACLARGCIWKVRRPPPHPRRHSHFLFLFCGKSDCEVSSYLSFLLSFRQPSNVAKAPWCFYPKDHGYNVTAFHQTATGFTLDIIRNANNNQSSAPADSPDINALRVEVFYNSASMLRFKVGVPGSVFCPTSVKTG